MGWPQLKNPIQTDNFTAAGVTNNTILPRWRKMMDMRHWWLHCHASKDQSCYYWDAGTKNWADYNTKHHPETYREAHHSTHAGIWNEVGTWYPPIHQTIGPWISPHMFSQFFLFSDFFILSCNYYTTSLMLPQGCVDTLILVYWQTIDATRLSQMPTPPEM
jgi:hypothetical protein